MICAIQAVVVEFRPGPMTLPDKTCGGRQLICLRSTICRHSGKLLFGTPSLGQSFRVAFDAFSPWSPKVFVVFWRTLVGFSAKFTLLVLLFYSFGKKDQ